MESPSGIHLQTLLRHSSLQGDRGRIPLILCLVAWNPRETEWTFRIRYRIVLEFSCMIHNFVHFPTASQQPDRASTFFYFFLSFYFLLRSDCKYMDLVYDCVPFLSRFSSSILRIFALELSILFCLSVTIF